MDKAATRDGFGKGLLKLGGNKDVVVLDAGVSDSTRTQEFGKEHPERFFNMGISEGDMLCTAAGMARCNKVAFAAGFTCFLLGRTMDQIVVSIAYTNNNVKIVGSHAGLATGEDGPTAQAIQDVAWLRSMPNMTIISPADAKEAEQATVALASHKGPAYLRVTRPAVPIITKEDDAFVIGKAKVLQQGSDVAIICAGPILHEAIKAAGALAGEGMSVQLVNMHTIKPLDVDAVKQAAATGAVVTAEDHSIIGGLGSAVMEVLCGTEVAVERIGVKDTFAESGTMDELYEKYGLDAKAIARAAKAAIARKRQ